MKKSPRVFFSLRSPYSWMAMRQLAEWVPQDTLDSVELVPFFEPEPATLAELIARGGEFHYVTMSKAKHRYILADTRRLAAMLGYRMAWPVDVDPSWELPHLAWLKARELGVHHEYYVAVTAARWERGEDICDPVHLGRVCAAAGLDAAALLAAPDDEHIHELGLRALMEIYSDDVFGVPYFSVGRQRFWGLDRLPDFVAALSGHLRTGPAPQASIPQPVLETVGSADHDTAGGCG